MIYCHSLTSDLKFKYLITHLFYIVIEIINVRKNDVGPLEVQKWNDKIFSYIVFTVLSQLKSSISILILLTMCFEYLNVTALYQLFDVRKLLV